MAKCWRRPGEKTSKQQPPYSKVQVRPSSRGTGITPGLPCYPSESAEWGCRAEDRVLQTAPGTNPSVPEQPDRKGRSSQCSELRTGHTGRSGLCPQGHRKVGRGEQNHQEMVNGKQFLGGKRRWPERIKQTENVSSSLFQIPFQVVISGGVSFGVTPGRKNWPKDSGPRQQGLGVSMSHLSAAGRASQESGSLLVLVRD